MQKTILAITTAVSTIATGYLIYRAFFKTKYNIDQESTEVIEKELNDELLELNRNYM